MADVPVGLSIVATIENATIEAAQGSYTDDADGQSALFPSPMLRDAQLAQCVTRIFPGAENILSVARADYNEYTLSASSGVTSSDYCYLVISGNSLDVQCSNVVMPGGDDVVLATIQWGIASSTEDGTEEFPFPQPFNSACLAVLTNRTNEDAEFVLPVTSIDKTKFSINRNNGIDGHQEFYWIAFGDCLKAVGGNFLIPIFDGSSTYPPFAIQGGKYTSRSEHSEPFPFPFAAFESCTSVITQRTTSGAKDILPIDQIFEYGFSIDRHNSIDGDQDFYGVAIGRMASNADVPLD